jgi:hypothetical protein
MLSRQMLLLGTGALTALIAQKELKQTICGRSANEA